MCRKMAREVYTNPKVIQYSRSMVFMRVFEDTEEEGARLARRFAVRGFPTLIILDSRGQEVDRILGFVDPEELIEALKAVSKGVKPRGYTI
ncbi:MAG: thioredoxin family protein [Acidobacteriota bacterium]|jgi:thioredoxin-related protein|nr:thioredoxin family protein [Acidobacteriota bacterium]